MRIAVAGGGLAGLRCAYELQKHGVHCVLFESAPQCGGRVRGAAYLLGPEVYRDTFRWIRDLGLNNDLREIPPITGQFYKGHTYYHHVASVTGLLSFRGLNIADKAMLARMAYLLSRYASQLDFHHPERGVALDNETVAAFVKRELSQNILNYVAGPLISTLFYYGSEQTSVLLYLNLARHMHNTRLSTLHGGLRKIAEKAAAGLDVRPGDPVTSIEPAGPHFRINGEIFDKVVLAVPGNLVLKIPGVPALLEADDHRFFSNCRYGSALGVSFDIPRRLGKGYGISIPRVERLRAATIEFHDFIDPSCVPEGRGRVTVVGGEGATETELIQDFQRIVPGEIERPTAVSWSIAQPKFPPGRFRELAEFLRRKRRAGLFFCGDYLMGPFIEAAVSTGLAAAKAVLDEGER